LLGLIGAKLIDFAGQRRRQPRRPFRGHWAGPAGVARACPRGGAG
jgi:hypothetical protein